MTVRFPVALGLLAAAALASPAASLAQCEQLPLDVFPVAGLPAEMSQELSSALALEGDALVAGAAGEDEAAPHLTGCDSGAAYVFVRDAGGAWVGRQRLSASDLPGGFPQCGYQCPTCPYASFGRFLASDGDRLLVVAQGDDVDTTGRVFAFTRDRAGTPADPGDDLWVWSASFPDPPGGPVPGDRFATALDLRGDLAVAGARGANDGEGIAHVYRHDGASWVHEAVLDPGLLLAGGAGFGTAVAVGDSWVAVGSPGYGEGLLEERGAVYLFERDAQTQQWLEVARFEGDSEGAELGIALSGEGDRVLAGAPGYGACGGGIRELRRDPVTGWSEREPVAPAVCTGVRGFGEHVLLREGTLAAATWWGPSAYLFDLDPVGCDDGDPATACWLPRAPILKACPNHVGLDPPLAYADGILATSGLPPGAPSHAARVVTLFDLESPPCPVDLDADGVADEHDNCCELPNPSQRNADAADDVFGNLCDQDYDQSGIVAYSDFNTFKACIGRHAPVSGAPGPTRDPTCEESDHDASGMVTLGDFHWFRRSIGRWPGPAGICLARAECAALGTCELPARCP